MTASGDADPADRTPGDRAPRALEIGGLDLDPLTAPVDPAEADAFADRSRAEGRPWARRPSTPGSAPATEIVARAAFIVVPLLAAVVFGSTAIAAIGAGLSPAFGGSTTGLVAAILPLAVALVLLVVAGLGVRALVVHVSGGGLPAGWWPRMLRLTSFATANGWRYGHEEPARTDGLVFRVGEDRLIEQRMTSGDGRVEIGRYRYVVWVRRNRRRRAVVHRWGYVAIDLGVALPHMLLDSAANDRSLLGARISNLPGGFDRDQVLGLEGDFDDHFTLYAPEEYERDALYVFTPDLMALLVDEVAEYDVEIVDRTLYVYGGAFDLADPATYRWLQRVVATIGDRATRRAGRYHDDRLGARPAVAALAASATDDARPPRTPPPQQVAEPGRRLRSRRGISGVGAVVGVVILWIVITRLGDATGPLGP